MILYRCDYAPCGKPIPGHNHSNRPVRIRWEAINCWGNVDHFCSIRCLTAWAEQTGYTDKAIAARESDQ